MLPPLTSNEIKKMERAGRLTADTLLLVEKHIRPGVTTLELDKIADDFIRSRGGFPTFNGYNGFPNSLCISVDECVVHGIPNGQPLLDGQIVSIDCGVTLDGFIGDSAVTYPVGEIPVEKQNLLKVTEESLWLGIKQAVNRGKVYDISLAVQTHCQAHGYSLTRELTGHGVGRRLHQYPNIPNFVPPLLHRRTLPNAKLYNGLGIAIEPMVHLGTKEVFVGADSWAIITRDGLAAAHFEHTLIISDNEPIITTLR